MDILKEYIVANEFDMAYVATETGDVQVATRVNNVGEKRRKLIIHFDIRNTVLVSDSVTNVTMEQALNSFLTGVVWGKERSKGMWVWESYETSLTPPSPDAITYYKHMERILVKTPTDRWNLRLVTGDFTQNIGKAFMPYFTSTLDALRWKHEVTAEHEGMTMAGNDGKPYHYLLKSVYKLIYHLVENNRDFAIVFRTYGLDAPNVISSIAKGLQGDHPDFPIKDLGLKVTFQHGLITRKNDDSCVFQTVENQDDQDTLEGSEITDERAIYNMLNAKEGISGYKDDFIFWQSNNYSHEAAKPLYVDPFDDEVHHIFFDDNIRTLEDDSIVNVRLFETEGCATAKSLSKTEAANFENVCLVQADLLMAIQDDDYYVKSVDQCEKNYTNFVNKYRLKRMDDLCSVGTDLKDELCLQGKG
ncbi:uncharacterized protein LOC110461733 [Mizuhopecten yessoensis]|uniref:Uncharacterized protein n=1 Tax=Mizuhopecten yessoensis TaxID=6573 RepID=A0A210PZU7_MIZYE|nr:uncharacterized protein LOC110461733 [Mizuhopecten yessoensis]OWF41998.1 hypothetical protein KP79_PYT11035 [Mizuhopecten yessoensis]